MASLVVRKLEDDLVPLLKARARRNGRSTEEEHRQILRAALRPASTGGELLRRLRAPIVEGADLDWQTGVDDTMPPAEFD